MGVAEGCLLEAARTLVSVDEPINCPVVLIDSLPVPDSPRAWAADHPEVLRGLYARFDLDNGIGRVNGISAQGLMNAGEKLARWISRLPTELSEGIRLELPGLPASSGRDVAPFIRAGAPAFPMAGAIWEYATTQHTVVCTYDKLVPEELRHNATLLAMLVYLADQDVELMTRSQRAILSSPRAPNPRPWPDCGSVRARRSAPPT